MRSPLDRPLPPPPLLNEGRELLNFLPNFFGPDEYGLYITCPATAGLGHSQYLVDENDVLRVAFISYFVNPS